MGVQGEKMNLYCEVSTVLQMQHTCQKTGEGPEEQKLKGLLHCVAVAANL